TSGRWCWHEFWLHYDRVANYWRLKKLGAQVSPYAYLAACLVSPRRRPLPRLLATLYGWLVKL
ncbi:MAG: glycosyltransferase family 2 protein, partial [Pyrobaculum sp.]